MAIQWCFPENPHHMDRCTIIMVIYLWKKDSHYRETVVEKGHFEWWFCYQLRKQNNCLNYRIPFAERKINASRLRHRFHVHSSNNNKNEMKTITENILCVLFLGSILFFFYHPMRKMSWRKCCGTNMYGNFAGWNKNNNNTVNMSNKHQLINHPVYLLILENSMNYFRCLLSKRLHKQSENGQIIARNVKYYYMRL